MGERAAKKAAADPAKWPSHTRIAFKPKNPKQPGKSAFERYELYKHSKTVQQALERGAFLGDLRSDYAHSYLSKVVHSDAGAIAYAVSLGSRCLVADTLRDLGLRRFAGPFDWVYTTVPVVEHILQDNFNSYLDKTQYFINPDGVGVGHKFYSPMLGRTVMFLHGDPMSDYEDHRRRVLRLRKVMASDKNKLFVYCNVIESAKAQQEAAKNAGKSLEKLFDALVAKCSNLQLLVVNLFCGKASKATETKGPFPQKIIRLGKRDGNSTRVVHNLHCIGNCTGLRLQDTRDAEALSALMTVNRKFDLEEDPMKAQTAKPSGVGNKRPVGELRPVLHPPRTVRKLNDGQWHPKHMD